MKKILFMLTAAMLTLTACQNNESLSFLIGEDAIAVDFDHNSASYESTSVENQYRQLLDTKQTALENEFVRELGDELEDVWIRVYHASNTPATNYTFTIRIDEVTSRGIRKATAIAFDKSGKQVSTIALKAGKEYERTFIECVSDTMEELADYLGNEIIRAL